MASTHKDLPAWQKGIELAKEVYHFTKKFPTKELHLLTAEMRRTAVKVPCKIAAGFTLARFGKFRDSVVRAEAMLAELETQAIIAHELGFCTADEKSDIVALILTEQRIVNNLITQIDRKAK